MVEGLHLFGWLFAALALLGAAYACIAGVLVGRFFRPTATACSEFPGVTLLMPLHGNEAGLKDQLEGFCAQDYPGQLQIVFGVHSAGNSAIAVVRDIQRCHPALDIDLIVDGRLHGSNRKVSNLINMAAHVRNDTIVLADSDVSVEPSYLRELASALCDLRLGFATCIFVGKPTGNGWSKLSAMALNYHLFPSVVLGIVFKLAKPCFGPTIALRKSTLVEIGGFEAFANCLADDYEIGRAIRDRGYDFALLPFVICHACPENSALDVILHELRWARTFRTVDPVKFAGSGISHAVPAALIGLVLLQFSVLGAGVLALAMASRLFLMWQVDRQTKTKPGAWILMPLRDVLSFVVYLASFAVNTVTWRGRRFRIAADGTLSPVG